MIFHESGYKIAGAQIVKFTGKTFDVLTQNDDKAFVVF